ncbi:MAG: branched-chain amino acid ABC transporter permease [Clostridiales Family XIII bacterium]|jgi:urea transport system permease protein|nr:branched-chain amino acid ABC transporter permease [Clostridiales Family XIII bacterium]
MKKLSPRLKNIPRRATMNALLLVFILIYPLTTGLYQIDTMAKVIPLMIFALSADLLWGYTGIMSLGQAVPFGIGAYIAAISNNVSAGIPSYMRTYGITEVPAVFRPLTNPYLGTAFAILIPCLLSFMIGRLLLTGKVRGVFVSLITMALSNVLMLAVNNAQRFTGGSNGVNNVSRPSLFGHILSITENYYFVALIAALLFAVCAALTSTKFGKVLGAIRVNENRVAFIGYNVTSYKVFVYVFSSALAAIAGILYARTCGMVSPSLTGLRLSILVIIWIAVGGRGNLTGALFGCLLLNGMERIMAGIIGDAWEFVIGIILLLIVFCVPDGLIGTLLTARPGLKKKEAANG